MTSLASIPYLNLPPTSPPRTIAVRLSLSPVGTRTMWFARCGHHHCVSRTDGRFHCNHCKANFSVTVGTIFENTKISLRKWFLAMYLISCHKKGISSVQLATDISVTQKTAWFILHKVRTLFA